jgi:hypothetical protein
LFELALIDTDGVTGLDTVIVIMLLVAGGNVPHDPGVGVNITFTWSLLASVVLEYVLLFVPTLTPFTCH